jgi:hypothetical protein
VAEIRKIVRIFTVLINLPTPLGPNRRWGRGFCHLRLPASGDPGEACRGTTGSPSIHLPIAFLRSAGAVLVLKLDFQLPLDAFEAFFVIGQALFRLEGKRRPTCLLPRWHCCCYGHAFRRVRHDLRPGGESQVRLRSQERTASSCQNGAICSAYLLLPRVDSLTAATIRADGVSELPTIRRCDAKGCSPVVVRASVSGRFVNVSSTGGRQQSALNNTVYSKRVADVVVHPRPIKLWLASKISDVALVVYSSPLAPSSNAAVISFDPTNTPFTS